MMPFAPSLTIESLTSEVQLFTLEYTVSEKQLSVFWLFTYSEENSTHRAEGASGDIEDPDISDTLGDLFHNSRCEF